ncbi:metalloregulator ArsR/SmtB family transcription factor [Stappia sp.]|uniref:ArsR/SmtB family transcription factor n=1 Tax=Stappia sp. TaxID=1870903 RepID=UPI0032D93534
MASDQTCPCTGDRRAERADAGSLEAGLKALAHPVRLEILQILSTRETACCGDLVRRLPLAQSTVSQHLSVLRQAGLIDMRGDGRCCHYFLARPALDLLSRDVAHLFASLCPASGAATPAA